MLKSDMNLTATQYGVIAGIGRGTSGATTMVAGYLGERFANRAGLKWPEDKKNILRWYNLVNSRPSAAA